MSQQINLFSVAFRKQRRPFSAATVLQGLCALAAASLAFYAFEAYQNRVLERVSEEDERLLVGMREQVLRFSQEIAARVSDRSVEESLARAEERLQARRSLLEGVRTGAGGNAQGFSGYLAALARRTTPGVWLTGVEMGRSNDLVLRGRVLQSELVPAYIKSLNAEKAFAGRAVNELKLTAREEPAAPPRPNEAPQAARAPQSFVEFVMSMPL
jgi:hypothetical protein